MNEQSFVKAECAKRFLAVVSRFYFSSRGLFAFGSVHKDSRLFLTS